MESSIQTLAQKVPLLTVNAGPRDGAQWVARLKEEYTALIKYVQMNKATGDDWFQISADTTGTKSALHHTHTQTLARATHAKHTHPQQMVWPLLVHVQLCTLRVPHGV